MSKGLDPNAALALMRNLLSDLDTTGSGRYSNTALANFLDRSHKELVGDILFPDSRIVIETPNIATAQLYQVPLVLKVNAVYVNGQLAVPSDLPTLEGRQINYWDDTGDGTQIPGNYSDAPPGSQTGLGGPQWTVIEPLSYPSSNGQWVTPAPDAQPADLSQRPRYYWRGGYIGLVPAPLGATTICIDCVRQPQTIVANSAGTLSLSQSSNRSSLLASPENFMDALVWGAIAMAKYADDGARASQQAQTALQNRDAAKRKLLRWRGEYEGDIRKGPKMNTLRAQYGAYRIRRHGSGGGYYNVGNW